MRTHRRLAHHATPTRRAAAAHRLAVTAMCEQGYCTYASPSPAAASAVRTASATRAIAGSGLTTTGACLARASRATSQSATSKPTRPTTTRCATAATRTATVGRPQLASPPRRARQLVVRRGPQDPLHQLERRLTATAHTYYCEANLCRGDRGYNQNCDAAASATREICYEGKCMATCASGVFSSATRSQMTTGPTSARRTASFAAATTTSAAATMACRRATSERFVGAAPGVCRPAGTRCDWCERVHRVRLGTNSRGFGYFECNLEYNECMSSAADQALPTRTPSAATTTTASPTSAPRGRAIPTAPGNIMRRFCRSEQEGPCGRRASNRTVIPELAAGYDVAPTPASTAGATWATASPASTGSSTARSAWATRARCRARTCAEAAGPTIDAAALCIDINPSGVVDPLFGVPWALCVATTGRHGRMPLGRPVPRLNDCERPDSAWRTTARRRTAPSARPTSSAAALAATSICYYAASCRRWRA